MDLQSQNQYDTLPIIEIGEKKKTEHHKLGDVSIPDLSRLWAENFNLMPAHAYRPISHA